MKRIYTFVVSLSALIVIAVMIFWRGDILVFLSKPGQTSESKMMAVELSALKLQKADFIRRRHYIEAYLYSRYPFNDKGVVVVSAGSDDGIRPDMPVMSREGVLLGRINSVKRTQSEVETIFNPSWRSSVYLGEKNIKAVLRGGEAPTIEFVPKEAVISKGDSVINSSPNLPFGAYVGEVSVSKISAGDLWQSAEVETGYSLDNIGSVLIVTDFP